MTASLELNGGRGRPPYGGFNRIRFKGYVSLHPVKHPAGDPWQAAEGSRNVE